MAWSIVSLTGAGAVTGSGPLVMTEPAGAAAGDLLVAFIAYRGTATVPVTNSPDWTLASGTASANTVTNLGTAKAAGSILWCIRGASAPSLSFPVPPAGNVIMARIVCYRGGAVGAPVNVVCASVTADNTTSVDVPGMTTTDANTLMVALCAGGQEGTWSAFKSANTPSTASGTSDQTTPPSTTAWIERGDSNTTGGSDVSLGVFDAVKSTAGATGNFTATTTIAAAHSIIVVAFKEYTPSVSVSVDATGQGAAVSVGSLTSVVGKANVALDIIELATASVGSLASAVGQTKIIVTTNLATASINSISSIVGTANIAATTNLATVGLGNESVVSRTVIPALGQGIVVSSGIVLFAGGIVVGVTGVQAATSPGTVSIVGKVRVTVTAPQGTFPDESLLAFLGNETVSTRTATPVLGQEVEASAGTVTVITRPVIVVGVTSQLTASPGTVGVNIGTNHEVTGSGAVTFVGTVAFRSNCIFEVFSTEMVIDLGRIGNPSWGWPEGTVKEKWTWQSEPAPDEVWSKSTRQPNEWH